MTTAPPATTTTAAPPTAQTVTVLPLGDSITFGVGSSDGNSYRKYLKDRLSQAGLQIDYIGTLRCGNIADNQCQGKSFSLFVHLQHATDHSL